MSHARARARDRSELASEFPALAGRSRGGVGERGLCTAAVGSPFLSFVDEIRPASLPGTRLLVPGHVLILINGYLVCEDTGRGEQGTHAYVGLSQARSPGPRSFYVNYQRASLIQRKKGAAALPVF